MGLLVGGLVVLFLAGPIALVALLVQLTAAREGKQHRLIVDTPRTPIAGVRDGSLVELHGRAVASHESAVVSPLSGRAALVCAIDVKAAYESSTGGLTWRDIGEHRESRSFWLDDGSGRCAWIQPRGAELIVQAVRYGGSGSLVVNGLPETVVDMTPQVEAWARQTTAETSRRLHVEERVIAEGDSVFVLGSAHERGGVLVLQSHAPERELLLSNFGEEQLSEMMRGRSTARRVALALSLVAVLTGVAMMVVALATELR